MPLPPGARGASSPVHPLVLTAVNVGRLMSCSRSWGWAWRGDSVPSSGKAPVPACVVLLKGSFSATCRALPVPTGRQHRASSCVPCHLPWLDTHFGKDVQLQPLTGVSPACSHMLHPWFFLQAKGTKPNPCLLFRVFSSWRS